MGVTQSPTQSQDAIPSQALLWLLAAIHIVCPLLFYTNLTRNPYFTQISLLQGGLCAALAVWLAGGLFEKKWIVRRTPLEIPLLALTAVCLASSLYAYWRMPPFRLAIWNESFRVTHFWIVNALLAFWISFQMGEAAWDKRLTTLIFLTGAVAAGYGVMQYMGHDVIWPKSLNPYSGRPVSTFGNPNFLSSYLVMLLPWVVAESFTEKTPWRQWMLRGCFLIYGAALICTMTRSSWLGAAAALALFFFWTRRVAPWPRAWKFLMAVSVAMALFWPGSPLSTQKAKPIDRMRELIQGVSGTHVYGSWHQRLMIWSCAWDMAKEQPVIGKGWGTFELFYPFYQGWYVADDVFRYFRTHANNAHNVILEYWSQAGTLGLGAFLWIFVTAAFLVWKRGKTAPPDRAVRIAAVFSALLGMGIDNFFGNVSLFFAVPAFLFWWLFGRLAWDLSSDQEDRTYPVNAPRLAAAAVLAVLCAGGVRYAYAQWQAEVHYFAGFKAAKGGKVKDAIAETEISRRWRRYEVNNDYELGNAWARQARWAQEHGLTQEFQSASQNAFTAYSDALSANAGYDEIYFNRGTVHSQIGRTPEAIMDYRTSLLINPTSMESYKALGNLYLNDEKLWPQATDLFERAVFYYPRDKDLWNNLGFLYTKAQRSQDAVNAFVKSIEIDVGFNVAWQNLHLALSQLENRNHPILAVPGLWKDLGAALDQKNWERARADAKKVLAILPRNSQALLILANVEFEQRRFKEAVDLYDQALALEPGQWDARLNKSKALLALDRKIEARDLLKALSAEKPQNEEVAALLKTLPI